MAKSSTTGPAKTTEAMRLDEAREKAVPWRLWGPYLSERQCARGLQREWRCAGSHVIREHTPVDSF